MFLECHGQNPAEYNQQDMANHPEIKKLLNTAIQRWPTGHACMTKQEITTKIMQNVLGWLLPPMLMESTMRPDLYSSSA